MGSGQVGRGGGSKGGPDNNVTIWPAPRTSRAVEESESKQWSVTEGVRGSEEGRGEWGLRGMGGSVSQGLDASCSGEGAEICVCADERAHKLAAEGQGGHKVAALQCWHVVCICRSVF